MASPARARFEAYFSRFGFVRPQIAAPPHPDLRLIVVIPVHDEPELLQALDSLLQASPPEGAFEIILVFNGTASTPTTIQEQHQGLIRDVQHIAQQRSSQRIALHCLNFPDMPRKHAGVGLARKLGLDEAAYRFSLLDRLETGVLICYDADCTCASNFLVAHERHFETHPATPACSTAFEHPLSGPEPDGWYQAVAAYELHLRYYIAALRTVRFRYAYHTIGSSMAVRPLAYLESGGMNRRKAGEDFYFLQKLMTRAPISELNTTTVYPSVRPSHRVPFGTGRAINHILEGQAQTTYAPQAFADLIPLIQAIHHLESPPGDAEDFVLNACSPVFRQFLEQQQFPAALDTIRRSVASLPQTQKRLWQWFDGFRCMRFLNESALSDYPRVAVETAAHELAIRLGIKPKTEAQPPNTRDLLQAYRAHQRQQTDPTQARELR